MVLLDSCIFFNVERNSHLVFSSPNLKKMKTSNSNELSSSRSCCDLITVLRENCAVSLVGSYLFLYVGAETSYGGWIFTYAVEVYGMDETNAAYLSSVFWGAMVVGRLAAVFLSTKISAHRLLSLDMTGSIVSIAMLLLFDSLRREIVLWIVSIGFGLFMASIYATAFSLRREMDINVTSISTSIMIVFSSLEDMGLPVVAGWLITHLKPRALIWMILCVFLVALGFSY